ncbi:hypothetical protein GOODEAATRI_026570 [Goodea atripinnis]|uniref:Uncharacterized protein n=1 Tax=Goodea atripinnis TaxID=208336 RepID=A0ABV0Q1E6_9TELE
MQCWWDSTRTVCFCKVQGDDRNPYRACFGNPRLSSVAGFKPEVLYNKLKMCVEASVKQSWCMGYTFMVDEVFLKVHQMFFSLCRQVHDPPLYTLLMLIVPSMIVTFFLPFLCVHLAIGNPGDS